MNTDSEETTPLMQNAINIMDISNETFREKIERKTSFLNPKFEAEKYNIKLDDLKLSFLNENQNEDLALIRDKLKQLSSATLFHWKNVPIVFPASIYDPNSTGLNKNLFILPTFNELEEIATDSSGKTKKLNEKQLESIKREGKFEVESAHFPGKTHKWVLARWLQKGYRLTNQTFFEDISNSLHLLIVTAKNRFVGDIFSVLKSLKAWKQGTYHLIDKLIGLPHKYINSYDESLLTELQKFLVQDLKVDPTDKATFDLLCQKIQELDNSKPIPLKKDHIAMPYLYRTSDNRLIDLRLLNRNLMTSLEPILTKILALTNEEKELIVKIREESIKLFKGENYSNEEIVKKTNEILFNEYFKSLSDKILSNSELDALAPGIGLTLIQNAKAILLIKNEMDLISNELTKHLENYEVELKKKYRIRSLVNDWLHEAISQERKRYIQKNLYEVHLRSLKKCYEEGLYQAAYFIEKELEFLNKKSKPLIEEYKKSKSPSRKFYFNRWIWFPRNYIINKTKVNDQIKYSLQTYVEYKNSTNYPFWRWTNLFLRTWVYLCNSFYIFGLVIPFASPVSFRALFSLKPFYPGKTLDYNRGVLIPNPSSKTLTYVSRLCSIWSHVRVSRQRFEQIPDKGLIGKTIQRVFNRIWNYFFKGIFGSIGLTLVYPALCLIASTISILIAILTPIWYPILSVFHHLAFITIYDWDYYENSIVPKIFPIFAIFLVRIGFLGIIQPIAALGTAIFVCPLTSLVVATFAVIRNITRKFWDNMIFYCILKPQARVPSHDTFVARRIEGPGLAANYFYQAKPEQCLAALEANLEIDLLNAYVRFIKNKLQEPLEIYQKLFNPIFKPFSYNINQLDGPYRELSDEINHYNGKYQDQLHKRLEKINKTIQNNLHNIRLSEKDLSVFLHESSKIVKEVYESSILKYENKSVYELFEQNGISDNDWTTFTGTILERIFGTGILTHLEDSDNYFSLEVNHLNLKKYSEMIAKSELRDDLDLVAKCYNPKGGHVAINMPSIERYYFSSDSNSYYTFGETDAILSMPPRLPENAAIIAIHVHNAHNKDKPIEFTINSTFNSLFTSYFKAHD